MKQKRELNLIELMLEETMQEVLDELCEKYVGENNRFDNIDYRLAYYADSDRFYKEDGTYVTLKTKPYQISAENCSYQNLFTIVEDRLLLNANGRRNPIIYVKGFDVVCAHININMGVGYLD